MDYDRHVLNYCELITSVNWLTWKRGVIDRSDKDQLACMGDHMAMNCYSAYLVYLFVIMIQLQN